MERVDSGISEEDEKSGSSKNGLIESEGSFIKGEFVKKNGLGVWITSFFIVGDIAGGGLISLPTAMIQSGFWFGLGGLALMTMVAAYTAYVLGRCWTILVKYWPEYRGHTRKPYPEIAYRAAGPHFRILVSICIDITQFGVAVVYLLLSAKNIRDFVETIFRRDIGYCIVILVLAFCLLPITFLKSPQDFWAAVVMAMFTTGAAVVLIVAGAAMDYEVCAAHREMPEFRLPNLLLALGTLTFAVGGHSRYYFTLICIFSFPTIQHDMRKPAEFSKAAIISFILTFMLYLPVCAISYLTYGDSLRDSIINSLQLGNIQRAVNMLITVHCILTLTIVLNPINQEAEELFNVPHEFGMKRVIVRVSMMIAVVFAAESVPTFGPLLDFVGGSTLTLTSIVFPCIFYVCLAAKDRIAERRGITPTTLKFTEIIRETDWLTLSVCTFIIVCGTVGGTAATYSAIKALSSTHFVLPCYLQSMDDNDNVTATSSINCVSIPWRCHQFQCGHYQNITAHYGILCSDPDLSFYG